MNARSSNTDFVTRHQCPLCAGDRLETLVAVPPAVFVDDNPTIDLDRLRSSGLLELDPICLVRCVGCKFCFTDRVLSDKWLSVFWDHVYIAENSQSKILQVQKRRSNIDRWSRLARFALSTNLSDGETLNVLDLGCGWGDFLLTAKAPGVRTIGIEVSRPKIEFAKSQGIEVYESVDRIPDEIRFHVLYCDQVFEHLAEPAEMLNAVMPRMHEDFCGYIAVPDYPECVVDRIVSQIKDGIDVHDKDLLTWDHLNYFSPHTFAAFLEAAGIVAIELPAASIAVQSVSTAAYVSRRPALQESAFPAEPGNAAVKQSNSFGIFDKLRRAGRRLVRMKKGEH